MGEQFFFSLLDSHSLYERLTHKEGIRGKNDQARFFLSFCQDVEDEEQLYSLFWFRDQSLWDENHRNDDARRVFFFERMKRDKNLCVSKNAPIYQNKKTKKTLRGVRVRVKNIEKRGFYVTEDPVHSSS